MDHLLTICPVCEQCAKKKCSQCRIFKYCSQICQRAHWTKYHKQTCMPIESTESAIAFIQNYNDVINQESNEAELVYWFGTLLKLSPILLQYISKEQISSGITNLTVKTLLSTSLNSL